MGFRDVAVATNQRAVWNAPRLRRCFQKLQIRWQLVQFGQMVYAVLEIMHV
jgi:hypothetical protein